MEAFVIPLRGGVATSRENDGSFPVDYQEDQDPMMSGKVKLYGGGVTKKKIHSAYIGGGGTDMGARKRKGFRGRRGPGGRRAKKLATTHFELRKWYHRQRKGRHRSERVILNWGRTKESAARE